MSANAVAADPITALSRVSIERIVALEQALTDVLADEGENRHRPLSATATLGEPPWCRCCHNEWPCAYGRAAALLTTPRK